MLNMQQVDRLLQKTVLYAIGKTKEARFSLGVYNNFLNFKVFVRDIDPNGKLGKSKMAAYLPFNRQAILAFVEVMKKVRDAKEETALTMESLSPIWENDKMTNETKSNGKISVVKKKKDGELINYIVTESTLSSKRFVFQIAPSPYVKLYKDGKELPLSEASNIWMDGYIKTLESVLDLYPEVFIDQITFTDTEAGKTRTTPKTTSKSDTNTTTPASEETPADTTVVTEGLDDLGDLDDLGI